MSGTFRAAEHDIGTFFNRIGPAGDIGLALGALLTGGALAPELGAAFGAGEAGAGAAADVGGAAAAGEALPFASTLTEGTAPFAIPGFTITPPAELGATIGPVLGTAADVGGAAAAGAGAGDVLSGLGLGSLLGITPALGGELSPASRVSGGFNTVDEFRAPTGGLAGTPQLPSTPVATIPVSGPLGGGTAASPVAPGGQGGPANTILPDASVINPGGVGPGAGSVTGSPLDLTAPAATTTPTAATPSALSNFFSKNAGLLTLLGLGVGGQLASPALSNALGLNKIPGSQDLKALAETQKQLAGVQAQLGQTLETPLVTGVLPPGQQQAVTNALNDAITTIKSRYANLGLSGSTMEAQAIADAQNRSTEVAGQLEQQMAQTGVSAVSTATNALGLESQIYDTLLNAQIAQDEQLGNAISGFANAVGLGTALGAAKTA